MMGYSFISYVLHTTSIEVLSFHIPKYHKAQYIANGKIVVVRVVAFVGPFTLSVTLSR